MSVLGEQYPSLTQFLNAWVSDSEDDDHTIVNEFLQSENENTISSVISDIDSCSGAEPFLGIEVGEEANRYFVSEQEAKEWLHDLIELFKRPAG